MADGKNLVGVDIGSSSIKVCQLRESRKGLGLVRVGHVPLPPQSIVDGHVMNAQAVVEALGRVFAEAKIKQKEVALSISGQAVIIRKISVPMMTAAELDEQIQWEAEQHIPFDIKDVNVDYQVLRHRPEVGQMDLLLVAAKRDEINEYAQIARSAKLKPVVVDIDAFTVQSLFEMNRGIPPNLTFAIINVGASLASINIVSRGTSAFTRDISNGGNYITEQIQRQLNLSFEQAEEYKCQSGANPTAVPTQVFQVIEGVCDSIAGEIQRSLDFFLATSGEPEMHRIYLTGGSSIIPALAQAVERRSRVPCEVLQPMERIAVDAKEVNTSLLQARAAQFSVALGLSMRKDGDKRVNLLPQKRGATRGASPQASQRWLLVVVAAILLELAGLFFFHQKKVAELERQQKKNNELEGKIADITKIVANHEEVKKALVVLRAREDAIAKLQAGRTGPTAVLLELAQLLTPQRGPTMDPDKLPQLRKENPNLVFNVGWDSRRLWLTSYVEQARTVKVEGLARDGGDVSEFAQRLKLSNYFYDVQLLPAKTETEKDSKLELVNFALQMKVRY
jgi:type IV pilus assembly protein PilM